jgi:hypothetical protein
VTTAELDAIEARAQAATEGPWATRDADRHMVRDAKDVVLYAYGLEKGGYANAAFIAAARQDVPRLVAAVRELRAVVEECEWASYGCPVCGHAEPGMHATGYRHLEGHASDCALAAALGVGR